MKNKLLTYNLRSLTNLMTANDLVQMLNKLTGKTFEVTLIGGTDYITHVRISTDGKQIAGDNVIEVNKLLRPDRFPTIFVDIYYSEDFGIKLIRN